MRNNMTGSNFLFFRRPDPDIFLIFGSRIWERDQGLRTSMKSSYEE